MGQQDGIQSALLHGRNRASEVDVVVMQSQVVYGSIGNSIAVPAIKQHDLRALAVSMILFGNTPHYEMFYGGIIPGEWFVWYLEALKERDVLCRLRIMTTGYMGNAVQIKRLAQWLTWVQARHPGLYILVDPVIGNIDSGVYVKAEIPDTYRQHLLPLAQGITPNLSGLEALGDQYYRNQQEAVTAVRNLLPDILKWVVVTSASGEARSTIDVLVVMADAVEAMTHPRVETSLEGTDDLFCAGLASGLLIGLALGTATQAAARYVLEVMNWTIAQGCDELILPSQEKSR